MSDPSASMIIVAHSDRPARFDVEDPKAAMPTRGGRIVVVGQDENPDPGRGIIEDPTSPQVV